MQAVLVWLGGGEWRELGECHERSTHVVAGAVVVLGAALAWLVATLAVAGSTRWPMAVVVPLSLAFGVLVATVSRAIASGRARGRPGVAGRAMVALAVGVVVGELAALVVFSGSIDRLVDEQAARRADSVPAVAQAATDLSRSREARAALDDAVEQARRHRDEALVIARCEYNPRPDCPQIQITGVPGAGPGTRTANEFLADSERELDNALAERDDRAAELDAQIADDQLALALARETAITGADHGLGARWVAMNDLAGPGVVPLRLLTIGFFALLSLLPLILKLWRGETTHDRNAAARAERERAELEADTAIAVKRAEVRAAAEAMRAQQQLESARLAAEAQTEIDRELQRRRVIEAAEGVVQARVERVSDGMFVPIAAEAEAAGPAASRLPTGGESADAQTPENVPARVESGDTVETRGEGGNPLVPTIPGLTKRAARWIRPFVPPIVARAIDTTTQPVRAALQVLEETEEIHFTLKRTRKVTVHAHEIGEGQRGSAATETTDDPGWIDATTVGPERSSLGPGQRPELPDRDGPGELRGPAGPRQLPSAE